jgi:hypothetical protein
MLGLTERQDVKNASLCLAIIATIEVPAGKWEDFLDSMMQ